jgi:hypothetical protein
MDAPARIRCAPARWTMLCCHNIGDLVIEDGQGTDEVRASSATSSPIMSRIWTLAPVTSGTGNAEKNSSPAMPATTGSGWRRRRYHDRRQGQRHLWSTISDNVVEDNGEGNDTIEGHLISRFHDREYREPGLV